MQNLPETAKLAHTLTCTQAACRDGSRYKSAEPPNALPHELRVSRVA
ncbi:MAG: hypothetical protein ACREPR_11620 [Brasilonema sp.]